MPKIEMDFLDLVNKRHSVRAYSNKPVQQEKIERCIEAARLAPSACNSQPWTFIVVTDTEKRNNLADTTSNKLLPLNHFTKQAPVMIVIVIEKPKLTAELGSFIKDREFPLIDIGIAAEHICLQAVAEGLGTCMLGWFNEKKVKKILGIPASKRVGLMITMGYPSGNSRKNRPRKETDEILRYNHYKNQDPEF
jgi:nitroreductase